MTVHSHFFESLERQKEKLKQESLPDRMRRNHWKV